MPAANDLFSIKAGVPDMVNLTTLDEESMVSNLHERFKAGLPYTVCGQICVSVNPFRWLPLYEDSVIHRYHASSNPFVTEPPHVYPVAHAALTRLQNGGTTSQSILVSGESGAGKTEATKICMQVRRAEPPACQEPARPPRRWRRTLSRGVRGVRSTWPRWTRCRAACRPRAPSRSPIACCRATPSWRPLATRRPLRGEEAGWEGGAASEGRD